MPHIWCQSVWHNWKPFYLLALLEDNGGLSNDKHLLVLHVVVRHRGAQRGLDRVLDLGLGLLTAVLVLEIERGDESDLGSWCFFVAVIDKTAANHALEIR